MSVERKLQELGIVLPSVVRPVAAYVPATQSGDLVYTAGQLPFIEGKLKFAGRVGKELTVDEGAEAARICVLNALAAVEDRIGDLERVDQIVKLTVFVNCADEFNDQAKVANGASTLLESIFGERGKHARCALGANSLPLGAPVELDLIVSVRD